MLRERLTHVHQRIQQACRRCGRDPSTVTLIGVTKGVPAQTLQEALTLGLTDVGENRVQEARRNYQELVYSLQSTVHGVRWHLIGHLQRNKAKEAVEIFHVIHSVDSVRLAEELERQVSKSAQGSGLRAEGRCPEPRAQPAPAMARGGPGSPERLLDVFIQVNVAGEATKFGCAPDDALPLARVISGLPNLRLSGLMTMAPYAENPEASRPYFRRLRELRDALPMPLAPPARPSLTPGRARPSPLKLSMGMSQDFEVAIEEGADFVRIGTALFGDRPA